MVLILLMEVIGCLRIGKFTLLAVSLFFITHVYCALVDSYTVIFLFDSITGLTVFPHSDGRILLHS